MKKLIILACIALAFVQCSTQKKTSENTTQNKRVQKQKQLNNIVTKGLLAHFEMNKTAQDRSGNNNHGSIQGGVQPTTDRFGNKCGALHFNGTNAYISVPSSASLNEPHKEITICGWFRLDANSAFSDLKWVTMVCKANLPQEELNSPQYRLQLTSQTISLNTDFTENVQHAYYYEQWHFYAMTYNGSEVKSYLDGHKVFEFPYWKPLHKNDLPLEIGRDVPGNMEYFAGALDDIRIYNRSLSTTEVQQLYKDETPKSTTIDCGDRTPKETNTDVTEKGEINIQHDIEVNNDEITIYIYDHARPDGDIVSINLNDKWVVQKHELKRKSKQMDKTMHFKAKLRPNQTNLLFSKAWNLGKNPPNTLTLEIHDGFNKPKRVTLNSEIGKSGAVQIRCVL